MTSKKQDLSWLESDRADHVEDLSRLRAGQNFGLISVDICDPSIITSKTQNPKNFFLYMPLLIIYLNGIESALELNYI